VAAGMQAKQTKGRLEKYAAPGSQVGFEPGRADNKPTVFIVKTLGYSHFMDLGVNKTCNK
jgi:hypothetical protein